MRAEGGGWRVEGGGWRVKGGGWRVASRDVVEKFAAAAGDPKRVQVLSGEGIGDVEAIQPAEQIIHDVEAEAISQIAMLLELMVATGI